MHVLLTNDDSINHPGIKILSSILSKNYKVTIVAPSQPQSAKSHSITVQTPIYVRKISENEYEVNGTPADTVQLALTTLLTNKVDVVISGINNGPNVGYDTFYSGTVAAAREGAIFGLPSFAFSIFSWDLIPNDVFEYYSKLVTKILAFAKQNNLLPPPSHFYNINFPLNYPPKGIKLVPMGSRIYHLLVRKDNSNSYSYYIKPKSLEEVEKNTDVYFLLKGYATFTVMTVNQTAFNVLSDFERKWDSFTLDF